MEGHEFLTEYRTISNKLKKRFMRRPNVSEASDHFRQLAKRLEDGEEPQYAALCHLATGRCEQSVGNGAGEVEAITQAARSFLKAEMEIQSLKNPSFEEHLVAAIASYLQAAKLQEEAGRPRLAAGLFLEVGDALKHLHRSADALPYYQKAADLQATSILDLINAKMKVASCYIASPDHHNALLVLSEVATVAEDHDPCELYTEIMANVEVLRVLLLLIIQPSMHNTSPNLLQVLDKYKWESDEDCDPCPILSTETSLLLQSVVMAVQVDDTEALLHLEDQLHPLLTDQQKKLLRVLVEQTLKK